MNAIKDSIKNFFQLKKEDKTLLIYLLILGFIYVLPIILADRYYNDDLSRSMYGFTGWSGDIRLITEKLVLFLCGGKIAADIAPLPLLLSILFFSYSLTIYAKEKLSGFNKDMVMAYGLIKVIYMPFMLSMLVFKYDCGPELWSLCLCILWAALPVEIPTIVYIIISVITSIMIMCMYQPSIGMCIVLTAIDFFMFFIDRESIENIKKKIVGLISLGLGLILYVLIIVKNYQFDEGDWRVAQTRFVINSDDPILLIKGNIHTFLRLGYEHLVGYSKLHKSIGLITVMGILLFSIVYVYKIKLSRWKKIFAISFISLSPIAMPGLAICPMFFSQDLNITIRLLVSISGYALFLGVLLIIVSQKNRAVGIVIMVACLLCQISYVYILGNAMSSQKEYEKYLAYEMASDIEKIANKDDEKIIVSIIGETPYAPETKTIMKEFPSMEVLVPRYITNNWWIGGAWLQRYVSRKIEYLYLELNDIDIDETKCVVDNDIYSIYYQNNMILIMYSNNYG